MNLAINVTDYMVGFTFLMYFMQKNIVNNN